MFRIQLRSQRSVRRVAGEMYKKESFERHGLTNERRVGRLEAVALEGPQIQLVVELILSIELGHEVLDRRRRLRGPVRRVMYEYVGSFFRRAPAPKRKREDDDGGPAPKKKVASRAEVVDLLRKVDENLSAPVEDDDDVVDLTV